MPRRVLVVDDEPDIREIAQVSLEMVGGWEVHTAISGTEALRRAADLQPEAILLDVMMPDLDGPSTFRKLQEQESTAHIPVILLTAKVQPADRRQFSDLGVAGVITKPFDPMALANQVREVLGWDS